MNSGSMKQFCIIFLIIGMLFATGCVSKMPVNETTATHRSDNITAGPTHEAPLVSLSPADSERYYYNIRIVPPSTLIQMEKELKPEEYLIHDEKGDLIGVVSPKYLVIRGDLVQLAQGGKGRNGTEFDKTDIAEHLIDIAFGFDNSKLLLFKTNKDYKFWFDATYTTSDLNTALEFAKFFNTISDSTQFEDEELELGFLKDNYEEIPYHFYNIKIIPENMLDDFKDMRSDSDHLMKDTNGTLIGIASEEHLYLLDTLKEEQRRYYIRKGVLYSMGLHGTSFYDRGSFFYREPGQNMNMSDLDIEAIKLLYGGRLKTGMDLEEAKKTLGLTV